MSFTVQTTSSNLEDGTPDQLIERFTKLIEKNPKHIVARVKRAEQFLRQEKYLQCQKDCRAILVFEESNIRAHIYLAACFLALGDQENAVENLSKAKDMDVDDEFRYALGEIKEWKSGVLFPITDPEFLPEDKRCKKSWKKPKERLSYSEKVKSLYANASFI